MSYQQEAQKPDLPPDEEQERELEEELEHLEEDVERVGLWETLKRLLGAVIPRRRAS